ncbi:uncharacterized protein LOC111265080 [Varroa jacobsoni]|uniref:Uncharacterized protein n=1 Tax=Varroa destructor TaxID=109461 RepID=A0A7M7MIZ3_VARDE|nr:uncharacterized protein LOC111253629 [Varroa destructor]XP_022669069.1 uncharacterized protein LOC111253629 [Varroa destructor]XP_022697177.1 uncharacterized protein LOC111265080 [Varroa jacobsoni]
MGCFGCRDGRAGGIMFAHVGFVATFLAFVTPYWLKSDFRAYSAQFLRTGLWETCFRSHSSPDDLEQRKFYVGCRWILTYEYNRLRDTLELPFFVSTQVFYTFAFTAQLIASIGLISIYVCFDQTMERRIIRYCNILLTFAFLCSTIAVAVFGAHANQDGWMPDPLHNYLSWSYASAVVGAFCQLMAAICLQVDSRHIVDGDTKMENLRTFG